jgi:HlyD family secretion protein
MTRRNILYLVTAIALLAGGAYFFNSKNTVRPFLWRTAKIEMADVSVIVTATGSINAVTTVQVGTQVSGTIAKIFVDFNSVVKKGQVIAILDTTFLDAAKEDAGANMDKAVVQVNQAKREFDRTQRLFDEQAVAKADYDVSLSNYETAKSILKSAKAQMNRATINFQYATIKAPISGTVILRNVDVGQTVISSFNTPTLFTIANDLSKMQVQANVDEADIGQVKVGQAAFFTVDAFPDEIFQGYVKQIRLQPTVVQNVVNYIVIIDVSNPDLKLMPGLTANINIKIQEHKNVLRIPLNAMHFVPPAEYLSNPEIPDSIRNKWDDFSKAGTQMNKIGNTKGAVPTSCIWIQHGKTIFPVKISTGISDGTFMEVSGNLKIGDEVVTGVNHGDVATPVAGTQNPFMPRMPTTRKRTMQ